MSQLGVQGDTPSLKPLKGMVAGLKRFVLSETPILLEICNIIPFNGHDIFWNYSEQSVSTFSVRQQRERNRIVQLPVDSQLFENC